MAQFEKTWPDAKVQSRVTEDDGTVSEVVRAELQGYDSSGLVWRRVAVDGTGQLKTTGGAGGGAATIADGADVAQGATTDGAVITDVSGTISGKLRGLVKWAFERMPASLGQKAMTTSFPVVIASDQGALTVASHAVTNAGTFAVQATLAAETTKVIGTVNVAASQTIALAAGAAVIGHVIVDTAPTTAVTVASLPLPSGAAVSASQSAVKAASTLAAATDTSQVVQQSPMRADASTLAVTVTAAVNVAATLTLPAAAAGLFHYITSIQIVKLYSVVGVAAGAGVLITTTNLPGGPVWTTEQLASVAGTATTVVNLVPTTPLKSSAAATNTTIVCPQQLQTIWRVNVTYYTAP